MLFVHDVHTVIGEHEFDFEDAVRDEYAPAIAADGARLLWYFHTTHGAGESYVMVTLTAVADGAAWERLAQRLRYGDLGKWRERVDHMRYASTSTLLVQTPWSPLGKLDFSAIPSASLPERGVVVLREDTLRGPGIAGEVSAPGAARERDVLRCAAAFTPALGDPDTLLILYRVAERDRWTAAFGADHGFGDWPGSLTPALPTGVRSTSRMLRTTPWSPLS